MVSITVQLNFDYALSFRFFLLWQPLVETGARSQLHHYTEHLEQEVYRRTQALEATNKELETFVCSVSHDLREPLRAIQAYNQILLQEHSTQLEAEGHVCVQRIAYNADRMSLLIQGLLAYSRLGRIELSLQAVDLSQLIQEVLNQLELELQEQQTQVIVDTLLPTVKAHRATLFQVLMNLLTNAIKFVAPGVRPHIRIRAEPIKQSVRLWIEDNGIGIDPKHHAQIFQVFERLHSLEKYPGTGIGLAIVQKGTEKMGGRVGLESDLGQGSRFWLELPKIDPT
ncbi:MAG TPA: hypothetical protein IGS53_23200 [Leptolyngbyaceae cyanobacterium M33_DOE_097]|uniref:histidine kinase n=1 Tax=Oscillatoriales cyanobacterium SpSt-418 TaxID=2282169 RepID=A0A7C3PHH6_9CYAN|nr:hypothetical protein [Leptolyngbyaceae cyanobacterium M33_DOE_097]